MSDACDCYKIIDSDRPHQCQLCKRNLSACLYINELSHKITLQAIEISQLKNELQSYELEVRRQRQDFQHLNMKYVAGIEQMADIQAQKELADHELEELSADLFEEANQMVASERRKKHQLEQLLRYTEDQLSTEQSQLYELRNRIALTTVAPPPYMDGDFKKTPCIMMRLDNNGLNSSNIVEKTRLLFEQIKLQQKGGDDKTEQIVAQTHYDLTNKAAANDDNSLLQLDHFRKFVILQQKRRNSIPSLISDDDNSVYEEEEEVHYSFFQLYPQQPPSEYLVRCELEDIEPCLQFGNSNSRMCIKVLMEQLSQAPCFIESISLIEAQRFPSPFHAVATAYYRPLWERFTQQLPSSCGDGTECSACGKKNDQYYYRFRLNENEDWLLIDQNCRDRLVAVCNFYSFVRNIQLGYYPNQKMQDLYLENIELRLKMFYARMGI